MKIEFRNADGGDIIQEKDSSDLKDVLSSITREGTEMNFHFGKDNFFHGYVSNIMYSYDVEESDEDVLMVFISEQYIQDDTRVILKELQAINNKID